MIVSAMIGMGVGGMIETAIETEIGKADVTMTGGMIGGTIEAAHLEGTAHLAGMIREVGVRMGMAWVAILEAADTMMA
jgi:hypothetical protein